MRRGFCPASILSWRSLAAATREGRRRVDDGHGARVREKGEMGERGQVSKGAGEGRVASFSTRGSSTAWRRGSTAARRQQRAHCRHSEEEDNFCENPPGCLKVYTNLVQ